jgi:hypothetical protein
VGLVVSFPLWLRRRLPAGGRSTMCGDERTCSIVVATIVAARKLIILCSAKITALARAILYAVDDLNHPDDRAANPIQLQVYHAS